MKNQQSGDVLSAHLEQTQDVSVNQDKLVDEMDKRETFLFLNTPANLHIKNCSILWKTGVANIVIAMALCLVSYYVDEDYVTWLTLLMPLAALLIERKERVHVSTDDVLFHVGWTNAWGVTAGLAFVGCFWNGLPANGIFLIYYISMLTALAVFVEMLRVRYVALPLCASIGIAFSSFRFVSDPELTIRAGLVAFSFFSLISLVIGGAVMQWQIKNHVKNPINFPDEKK